MLNHGSASDSNSRDSNDSPQPISKPPRHIFGTAEIYDVAIIQDALRIGYRAFDTAGMPRYYREDLLGTALCQAMRPAMEGGLDLQRGELYLQTKFTTPEAQDYDNNNMNSSVICPYSSADSLEQQVLKSVQTSLLNLRTEYIDAFLLHGLMPTMEETLQVWRTMETLVPHPCRTIGVCNVDADELRTIVERSRVPPTVVQNRFMPSTSYDAAVRALCVQHGMTYQAFWVVKANAQLMNSGVVRWLAKRAEISEVQVLYALILSLGRYMAVLNGSKNSGRLKADWDIVREWDGALPTAVIEGFRDELARRAIHE